MKLVFKKLLKFISSIRRSRWKGFQGVKMVKKNYTRVLYNLQCNQICYQ